MRIDSFMKAFGQALGAAMAEGGKFEFHTDEEGGVPLADLDLSGAAPDAIRVALSRADLVRISVGDTLAIDVTGGEAADALRFKLAEGSLKITRRRGAGGEAVVNVTMPPPRKIAIGGAGTVEAERMAADAKIAIGGAGTVRLRHAEGSSLSVKIGGSGTVEAAGKVEELHLSIGGSGKLAASDLEVRRAVIRIGGSGKAEFASDGEVEARIGGVGDIMVHGSPRCSLKASGAGHLRTVPRGDAPSEQAAG